ncbi:uncharacterized protein CBL_13700 [Carabus blaptoides fortunei]
MSREDAESLNGTASSNSLRYVPAPESTRNRTDQPLTEHAYNGTGYYVDNDDVDNSFTDIQTLFLACFATLVPLVLSLLTAFAVRILWRKYRRNRECRSYDGVLHQEESSDHLSAQSGGPLHVHLLNSDKVKTCESQFSITPDEIECSGSPVMYSGSSSRTNHASANGSIITMTLKNNHLIVETEERNDIIQDSRETTMKYSPSLQDGVFVVEVQQGVRARDPATVGFTSSPPEDSLHTDQRALVHNPPERFTDEDTLEEVDEEYYAETTSPKETSPKALKSSSTNTGLSQSTLSVSSGDPNPSYRYGNQQGYDNGYYGYPVYNGYLNDDPLPKLPDNKPKITSAVYKQNGRLMSMASIDPEGGLSSDKLAKQNYVPESESDDAIQEEQRRLGNMPREGKEPPAIYNQIKQTIIPTNSPKFEKLQNDLSPSVDINNTSTTNTSTKQHENKAFESTETRNN